MLDWVKSKINGNISGIGLIVFGVVVLLAKPFATIAAIAVSYTHLRAHET